MFRVVLALALACGLGMLIATAAIARMGHTPNDWLIVLLCVAVCVAAAQRIMRDDR